MLKMILVGPFAIAGKLLNQFLLSPWGLVVPMTLLLALVAVQQVQKSPDRLARFYAQKLETCDASELPQIIHILLQMGDAGVPGLVKGLASKREDVFSDCLRVLQHQFDHWQESENREHHFRIFAEALLKSCHRFSHVGQTETMQFVDRMMQIREIASASEASAADRHEVIVYCGQIMDKLESIRQRRNDSASDNFSPQTASIAALNQRTERPVLLASNGQPFVPTSARQEGHNEALLANAPSVNPFTVTRSDRLLAYQRAQQNHQESSASSVARNAAGDFGWGANAVPPSAFTAEIEQKFAQNFSENHTQTPDISQEYRHQLLSDLGGAFGLDDFLTAELRDLPRERIAHLSAVQLMRLLHHPEPGYVEEARRILVSRDGFQEPHLRLAWRLYHPVPAVRQEIVAMLPQTQNVQPAVWLTVLLNDPDNEVRYRTASFLATTGDPALRQLLIERGKRDSDVRIVNLAHRLAGR
ncbi:MAG: HEAT repeat domain-containing protein [Planctomycetaceae bacterium]|nr:HEAT repeat domain-containing protein [Planctomycetaceae bacterium]